MNGLPKINLDKVCAELCKRSFYDFVIDFWDEIIAEPFVDNWHIPYLCDELQKVGELVFAGKPKEYDLIINISPGTTKSTIATVMFPAWCWARMNSARVLTSSYSASLSIDHSIKSRDIINSQKYLNYFGVKIRSDQNNKGHYKNAQGGERYATSVTGTATGFHAHILIVDDPLNPKTASSDAERESANKFMSETLSTRKVNKEVTPTILIMQRLHEDDCTGAMLKKQLEGAKIKHICIPAEISEDVKPIELKENYIDGLMDINRLNREVLNDLKISLGSYGYAGQIMQTPSPKGGGIWKDWFKIFSDDEIPKDNNGNRLIINRGCDWDLAYTEKETNSASAFVDSGYYDNKMYVFNIGFEWLEFPNLIEWMKAQTAPHYIEAKASGKSAKQVLNNNGIPAIEVSVDGGDKIARATMATPYAEAGLVYVHERAISRLLHDQKQGLLKFPNTGTDLNDAFVQAINRHLNNHKAFVF